jgi:hypothetical protein
VVWVLNFEGASNWVPNLEWHSNRVPNFEISRRQQTRWTISFSDLVLGARLEDQAARPSLRSTRGRSTGTQRSLATPTARCLDPVFQCQRCHCSIPFFSSSIPPAGGGPKKRAEPDAPGAGRIRRELPALTAKKRSGGWAREGWLRRPRR